MALEDNLLSNWSEEGNGNDNKGTNHLTDSNITYGVGTGKYLQGATFNAASPSKQAIATCPTAFKVNDFTWACWYKGSAKSQFLINAGGNTMDQMLYIDANGYANFQSYWDAGQPTDKVIGTVDLTDGAWHFIVAVRDQSGTDKMYLYVDGSSANTAVALSGSAGFTGTAPAPGWWLGIRQDAYNPLTGSLDEASIWSRAITSDEVTTLWNLGSGMHFNGTIFVSNINIIGPFPTHLRI